MQAHPNFFTMTFSKLRSLVGIVMVTFSRYLSVGVNAIRSMLFSRFTVS